MKKIFLSMILALFLMPMSFSQSSVIDTEQGQLVTLNIPITLAKAASYYSDEFNLDGYLSYDSTNFFSVLWQSNDTVQVTITLEVRNTTIPSGTAYIGVWLSAVTIISVQANAGNDTLWVMNVVQRGAIKGGTDNLVTMAGKIGNIARIKVAFANRTTVGNSGQFRLWAYLPRR